MRAAMQRSPLLPAWKHVHLHSTICLHAPLIYQILGATPLLSNMEVHFRLPTALSCGPGSCYPGL
jgi:hypothetical protein